MGHFIITSHSRENVQIALDHSEWGLDRKGTPINIGDTVELRIKNNTDDENEIGSKYVATLLVTSEPIVMAEPGFEWPDKPYPVRFNFNVVRTIPENLQQEADEVLRHLMHDHGLKGQFLWIGMQDLGNALWSSLMAVTADLVG